MEEENQLPFLDVLLKRTGDNKLQMKVHRKKTCSNIYIHWKAFAPKNWKIGTLKGMFRLAYLVCSEESDLKKEIQFLMDVFKNVISRCHREIKEKMQAELSTTSEETNDEESTEIEQKPYMLLPYAGDNGEKVMRRLKKKLPEKLRPRIVYNGTKMSSFFPVKDKINTLHCNNVVQKFKRT